MKWIATALALLLVNILVERLFVFSASRIIEDTEYWNEMARHKTPALAELIHSVETGEAPPWLADSAPLIWWHETEKYPASDPVELLQSSHIWYRKVSYLIPFWTVTELQLGPDEKSVEKHSPQDVVTRLYELGGINNGLAGFELRYDPDQKLVKPAPLLWRLGFSPLFKVVQPEANNKILLPIEFWSHNSYNYTGIYFGNHFGDWESFLILFEVSDKNSELIATPLYYNTSAHGHGDWHCKKDLSFENHRLQLYSAVGTHATYTSPGTHYNGIYPDHASRGKPWETWKLLRPLVKEPYYGFSGSWGATSFVHWMNGPLPPGPKFKYLPGVPADKVKAQYDEFVTACAH